MVTSQREVVLVGGLESGSLIDYQVAVVVCSTYRSRGHFGGIGPQCKIRCNLRIDRDRTRRAGIGTAGDSNRTQLSKARGRRRDSIDKAWAQELADSLIGAKNKRLILKDRPAGSR